MPSSQKSEKNHKNSENATTDPTKVKKQMLKTVNSKYHLVTVLNGGSFGVIYLARNVHTRKHVAVKVEPRGKKSYLERERDMYKLLGKGKDVPKLFWYGQEKAYNVLVMDVLGPSLALLLHYCKFFSYETIIRLALQMITCIEKVHKKGIVHRDIKPANFVMGVGSEHKRVYLIDFGLAMQHRGEDHVKSNSTGMVGTARYASLNAHRGQTQSYRDDMEALGYALIYFVKGALPWQGIHASPKKKCYKMIYDMKVKTPTETLCPGLPVFSIYLNYCRELKFNELPNYNFLRQLFMTSFPNFKVRAGYDYEWMAKQRRKCGRNAHKATHRE